MLVTAASNKQDKAALINEIARMCSHGSPARFDCVVCPGSRECVRFSTRSVAEGFCLTKTEMRTRNGQTVRTHPSEWSGDLFARALVWCDETV